MFGDPLPKRYDPARQNLAVVFNLAHSPINDDEVAASFAVVEAFLPAVVLIINRACITQRTR